MRGLAYGIAAVAAAGIAIAIATVPNADNDTVDTNATAVSVDTAAMEAAGTLTLAVPEMSCEFSCFPAVKKTLEGNETVKQVTLAPQKEEGTIDNRQVIVQYNQGFDPETAIKMLAKQGFDDSAVVQ